MKSDPTVLWIAGAVAAALLAVAVVLLVRLVRARRTLHRAGLPTGPRWVFWGAVLYLVLPTDLLPDPVYLDDIGVLLLALRSMRAGRALPGNALPGPGERGHAGPGRPAVRRKDHPAPPAARRG